MKLKAALLLCALSAVVFSLAGCVDSNDNAGNSRTTTTTTTASSAATGTMNGEYEAGRDGRVNDNTADTAENQPEKDRDVKGDDTARPSDVTDDGVVSRNNNDDNAVSNEAAWFASTDGAYASSYIAGTALRNETIGWGLGKDRDDRNRPTDAVRAEEKYSSLGGRFLTEDGKICLTFDEGYENGYTAAILDTLKEKGVKAVFFVTYDYCRTAPELVQRMIDEGHTVGNHTWSHPTMPELSSSEAKKEVMKLHEYVKDEFGYEMTLFRFPKGEFSERTLADVHDLGYTSMFWSFAYADWDTSKHTDPAEALAKIEDSTHSGIYLLHAVSETNAQILGKLIDYWTEQGYTVGAEL